MANINESPNWEQNIYQLETTDVVRGGDPLAGGISNIQALQLANRTLWLKDNLKTNNITVFKAINSDITLVKNDIENKHIILDIQQNGKKCFIDTSNLTDNTIIEIATTSEWLFNVKIEFATPIIGTLQNHFQNDFYIYSGERASFLFSNNKIHLLNENTNVANVAKVVNSYVNPSFCLQADGRLVERKDYPRLWHLVNLFGVYISESEWLSNDIKKGFFSNGNGTSTFRIPDLRGLFIRNSDNNRGLDLDRVSLVKDGSFQNDENKEHFHKVPLFANGSASGNAVGHPDNYIDYNRFVDSAKSGGLEARPKNIAITSYINY